MVPANPTPMIGGYSAARNWPKDSGDSSPRWAFLLFFPHTAGVQSLGLLPHPFRASPEATGHTLLVTCDRWSMTALLPHRNSPICHARTTSIPAYSHQHPANLHHPHCIRGEVEALSSLVDCRTTY